MKVLSLFNGLSSLNVALERANIPIHKYYASEIDKYANQVTQNNYPATVQLGDILNWKGWDVDWSSLDLITGGFPCQSWSVAGKQQGDKDTRGKIFWTMLDVIQHAKLKQPGIKFLIENVRMKKDFEKYITKNIEDKLGKTEKHLINSSLVSAQNRNRFYWTNISGVTQPKDRKTFLTDIIETGFTDRFKSYCIDANYSKGGNLDCYFRKKKRQIVFRECKKRHYSELATCHHTATATDINANESNKRVYKITGKAPTLTTMCGGHREPKVFCGEKDQYCYYRKLTPLECERLQTLPDNYTLVTDENGKQLVSNTQRYKMIGNSWTVDVITHLLKGLRPDHQQKT